MTIAADDPDGWEYKGTLNQNGHDRVQFVGRGAYEGLILVVEADSLNPTTKSAINDINASVHILGGAGKDTLIGGVGNDSLDGGAGNDILVGDDLPDGSFKGHDYYYNSDGSINTSHAEELVYAADLMNEGGDDILLGGAGNDVLIGGAGNDYLDAGAADASTDKNYLDGGDGNDYLDGGAGHNIVSGGAGNDVIVYHEGDTISGGDGFDVLLVDTPEGDLDALFSNLNGLLDDHADMEVAVGGENASQFTSLSEIGVSQTRATASNPSKLSIDMSITDNDPNGWEYKGTSDQNGHDHAQFVGKGAYEGLTLVVEEDALSAATQNAINALNAATGGGG
ncbi:MAG: hypothetical protein LBR31_07210 [Desulfovibrio sp.]|nr:hypothetical protein [Desulfovibrio sp.]